MVLIDTTYKDYGRRRGEAAIAIVHNTQWNIFINLCKACEAKIMAAIPPSAFSAGRIREAQRDMEIAYPDTGNESTTKYFRTKFMELSPLKYNSKLMNSIWGFYNRYSSHNVKKVSDHNGFPVEMQIPAGISSNKGEPMLSLPSQLDNVWAAINVSQSH